MIAKSKIGRYNPDSLHIRILQHLFISMTIHAIIATQELTEGMLGLLGSKVSI